MPWKDKSGGSYLLKDTCKVVKKLMEADPTEMRFTILALAAKE